MSLPPAGTVEPGSCVCWLALLQLSNRQVQLRSSLSNFAPGVIDVRSLIRYPWLSSLLQLSARRAPLRSFLSRFAQVPSCSDQAIFEPSSDHPCRSLRQGPLSYAPAGTVELCSSAPVCRAMLQLSDRRGTLRPSLLSFDPGAVELCSGRRCRALLKYPWLSSPAPTK